MNYSGIGAQSVTRRAALAATGVPFAVMHYALIGVAIMVLGGVFMIAGRLAPRFAYEPIQDRTGKYRMRFTRNGTARPTGRHTA
jgi:hypothetical protein